MPQDSADQTEAGDNPPSPPSVQVEDVVDDSSITARLTRIYESTGWYTDLQVTTESGVVTISGVADTAEHRIWALDLAARTQDVVATIDQMTVSAVIDLETSASVVRNSLRELWREFLARLPMFLAALVVVLMTAVVAKLASAILSRVLTNRVLRASLVDLALQLSTIAIWLMGILVATVIAFPGMTPARAVTVLGVGSIAIGFAFKDIFENFFAGILILWKYPFDRGDYISMDDLVGRVELITIRNTMIRRLDGELAVVPNANLFKQNVDVLTNQPQRRVRIICGVAYGEDVDKAREVIRRATADCKSVIGKRTVEIFAKEFADSSINFEVVWWTGSTPTDIRRSRDEVVASIKRELDAAGIEIPFPYRTLTFQNPAIATALAKTVTGVEAGGDGHQ
jgi:small-conductance mechanosensitive channel